MIKYKYFRNRNSDWKGRKNMASYETSAELRSALAAAEDAADAKLAKLGRLSASARMKLLFDEGTFVETGKYIGRKTTELDSGDSDSLEPIVTGYGAINGALVFAFSQDFSRLSGALGEMHAKKICSIYDMAEKACAPIVGIFDSAGAKILEGVDALAGYGSVMARVASAGIPQIAVISGPCTGANAVISQMMDITVTAAKTGEMRMASSEILEDKTLGTPDKLAEQGVSAITAADDADALARVRTLMAYLVGAIETTDDANRAVNVDALMSGEYDVHTVINEVFDAGSFDELYAESAGMLVCGLASMNGKVVGVLANNPAVKGGKLCPGSADKALKFLNVCDRWAIPVITLADSCGIPSSDKAEEKGLAYKLALFAKAYATARIPKISVVLGRAYGSLYSIFGSKAIGADIAFALDSARISAMSPETAVEFLGEVSDESKHSETAERWAMEFASPIRAAKGGHIDDIIASGELRARIAAAVEMLTV